MIFTVSRLATVTQLSRHPVRYYRLPSNLTKFLDDYTQEYKQNQNPTVIESYKSIKSKVSEYEELKSFIDSSRDRELVEIAELDLESISELIAQEVAVIKDELVTPEKYDNENAMMEVVPGAGGQEASLFAEEVFTRYFSHSFFSNIVSVKVFNFYINYCKAQGCDIEIVVSDKSDHVT